MGNHEKMTRTEAVTILTDSIDGDIAALIIEVLECSGGVKQKACLADKTIEALKSLRADFEVQFHVNQVYYENGMDRATVMQVIDDRIKALSRATLLQDRLRHI
jgi:hypothetical protein